LEDRICKAIQRFSQRLRFAINEALKVEPLDESEQIHLETEEEENQDDEDPSV
jgi:hypothetical protein